MTEQRTQTEGSLELPGKVFQQRRNEKGLTIEQVKDATRLSAIKIQQLENDDFDALGISVFVQGYIRNYANYLGLDGAYYVEQYRRMEEEKRSVELAAEASLDQNTSSGQKLLTKRQPFSFPSWAAYALVSVVIVVAIVFFTVGKKSEEDANESVQKLADRASTSTTAVTKDLNSTDLDDASLEGTGIDSIDIDTGDVDSSEVAGLPLDQKATSGFVDGTERNEVSSAEEPTFEKSKRNALVTSVDGNEPQAASAIADGKASTDLQFNVTQSEYSEATDTELKTSDLVESVVFSSESLLEAEFRDECWVEVRDRNNKVVFADLRDSGDNLRLFGLAPFNVMLGNARAVSEMKINSEPVEIAVSGTRKTLRMQVVSP